MMKLFSKDSEIIDRKFLKGEISLIELLFSDRPLKLVMLLSGERSLIKLLSRVSVDREVKVLRELRSLI